MKKTDNIIIGKIFLIWTALAVLPAVSGCRQNVKTPENKIIKKQKIIITVTAAQPLNVESPNTFEAEENDTWAKIKEKAKKKILHSQTHEIAGWKLTDEHGKDLTDEFIFNKSEAVYAFSAKKTFTEFAEIIPPADGIIGAAPGCPLPRPNESDFIGVFIKDRIVRLSPYKIGKYEVTYKLWKKIYDEALTKGYTFKYKGAEGSMGTAGAPVSEKALHPVTTVSWQDAIIWCNAYTEITMGADNCVYRKSQDDDTILKDATNNDHESAYFDQSKKGFRLPTEAEWEFAARYQGMAAVNGTKHGDFYLTKLDSLCGAVKPAGFELMNNECSFINPGNVRLMNKSSFTWEELRDENARVAVYGEWFNGEYFIPQNPPVTGTAVVGSKEPNYLDLYDMSGNIGEWCFDYKAEIIPGEIDNPIGESSGIFRVWRSGSWFNQSEQIVSGSRAGWKPSIHPPTNMLGFRLAASL